jgi:hypothetical protein
MFVVDVIRWSSVGRSVCVLDLEVNWSVFWLRLVGVPAGPTAAIGLPPLNPILRPLAFEIELDPKTCVGCRVLAFEKHDGIDLGDDFVGISLGWFVPDGVTATGSREAIVDASKEFRLDWTPRTEYRAHRQSPSALGTDVVRDAVAE